VYKKYNKVKNTTEINTTNKTYTKNYKTTQQKIHTKLQKKQENKTISKYDIKDIHIYTKYKKIYIYIYTKIHKKNTKNIIRTHNTNYIKKHALKTLKHRPHFKSIKNKNIQKTLKYI